MTTTTPETDGASRTGRDVARSILMRVVKLIRKLVVMLLAIGLTIYLVRAFDSRRQPDLRVWHLANLDSEFSAKDERPDMTLGDYLAMEDRLFEELQEEVLERVTPTVGLRWSRYAPEGPNNPVHLPQNWNRTYELVPDEIRGAVLLLHGLTDSPYSLRHVGEIFREGGFYVLGLRAPGHGTIPAALATANWRDWMAATRMGARHVAEQARGCGPFFVVGYSSGGALAVKYAVEAVESTELPLPDRLILLSPAIGVTPFSTVATWHKALSWLPYFEKFKWDSIEPEYDPFKYVSFPKNAGAQIHELTKALQKQISQLHRNGRINELPPILTFQSLVDTTVLTDAIVDRLYAKLESHEHELVLFDVNRVAPLQYFLVSDNRTLLDRLDESDHLSYTLTLVTNVNEETQEVMAKTQPPGASQDTVVELGLSWPSNVYSLSHIAIPFPEDDANYGGRMGEADRFAMHLGAMEPRGERNMLRMSLSGLMRLRYNPFYGYLEQRLRETIPETTTSTGAPQD